MTFSTGPPSILQQLALSIGKSVCSTLFILPLLFIVATAKQVSDYSSLYLSKLEQDKKEMQVEGVPDRCIPDRINTPLRL